MLHSVTILIGQGATHWVSVFSDLRSRRYRLGGPTWSKSFTAQLYRHPPYLGHWGYWSMCCGVIRRRSDRAQAQRRSGSRKRRGKRFVGKGRIPVGKNIRTGHFFEQWTGGRLLYVTWSRSFLQGWWTFNLGCNRLVSSRRLKWIAIMTREYTSYLSLLFAQHTQSLW